jgi:hypothetical protein
MGHESLVDNDVIGMLFIAAACAVVIVAFLFKDFIP